MGGDGWNEMVVHRKPWLGVRSNPTSPFRLGREFSPTFPRGWAFTAGGIAGTLPFCLTRTIGKVFQKQDSAVAISLIATTGTTDPR